MYLIGRLCQPTSGPCIVYPIYISQDARMIEWCSGCMLIDNAFLENITPRTFLCSTIDSKHLLDRSFQDLQNIYSGET